MTRIRTAIGSLLPLLLTLSCQVAHGNGPAAADLPRLLVLDFGMRDDTLLPDVPAEIRRTASLAPYVRRFLAQSGYTVVEYAIDEETRAQAGNGYLLAHPDLVADLGRKAGADWVALGVQNKFSFLISWTRIHLVEVPSGRVVARAEADLRGGMEDTRITRRTALSLANQVDEFLREIARRRLAGGM